MRRLSLFFCLALLLTLTLCIYADPLPRLKPLEPAQTIQSFQLKPDFQIELIAAEPLIRDPMAGAIDENGRFYVVEYPEYNQYANKQPFKETGRVKLLEDTNGDGKYDRATIFADKLPSPSGVICWDGGVFIGAAPDILFCKDTDGDGKADVRKKIFTGFARDKAGEAMLNSFRWGLDNRIHVSTGLAGGSVRRADKPKVKPVNVRGQGFLFDPRTLEFEVTSGGGQHGMHLNDWGEKFVCSNSEPINMVYFDGRYLRRNPYLKAPRADVNLAPQGKYTNVFRISEVEPWRLLRTKLRASGKVRGPKEGGKASGFFTAATGITVYRGDAWPDEYRGNVFVGEVSGNLIYRAKLVPKGVGYTAVRAEPMSEFLASKDNWFRPAQFVHAPDGTLYVLDFYRELIEGAAFLPPEVLAQVGATDGYKRGRIYRIAPKKFTRRPTPQLGKASTSELVKLLEHDNGWHRDTAARLLYQRQDDKAVSLIRKDILTSKSALGRAHGLYALAGMNALREEDLLPGLSNDNVHVREHALRLAERFRESASIRDAVMKMTQDKNLRVRYQLAFTLGAFPGDRSRRALLDLATNDGSDSWVRLAILSASGSQMGEVFRLFVNDQKLRDQKHGRDLLTTLAAQIGTANRKGDVALLLQSIASLPSREKDLQQSLLRPFLAGQPADVRSQVLKGKISELTTQIISQAQKNALDAKLTPEKRADAIQSLGLTKLADVSKILTQCLKPQQPQDVQRAALETLGQFSEKDVVPILLKAWPGLSASLRLTATEVLLSRERWIHDLLNAVEQKQIARADLSPARIQLLKQHPEEKIRQRAGKLFTTATRTNLDALVKKYEAALKMKGNAMRGRIVFEKNCSACHRLGGVGNSIGADLSAIRDRGMDAVLLNVLDPNREVKPAYLTYTLTERSGRVLSGMIRSESANSLTIRQLDGQEKTILRLRIERLQSSGLSFMPEGLEKQINVQAMADLFAWLESEQQ